MNKVNLSFLVSFNFSQCVVIITSYEGSLKTIEPLNIKMTFCHFGLSVLVKMQIKDYRLVKFLRLKDSRSTQTKTELEAVY